MNKTNSIGHQATNTESRRSVPGDRLQQCYPASLLVPSLPEHLREEKNSIQVLYGQAQGNTKVWMIAAAWWLSVAEQQTEAGESKWYNVCYWTSRQTSVHVSSLFTRMSIAPACHYTHREHARATFSIFIKICSNEAAHISSCDSKQPQ